MNTPLTQHVWELHVLTTIDLRFVRPSKSRLSNLFDEHASFFRRLEEVKPFSKASACSGLPPETRDPQALPERQNKAGLGGCMVFSFSPLYSSHLLSCLTSQSLLRYRVANTLDMPPSAAQFAAESRHAI